MSSLYTSCKYAYSHGSVSKKGLDTSVLTEHVEMFPQTPQQKGEAPKNVLIIYMSESIYVRRTKNPTKKDPT